MTDETGPSLIWDRQQPDLIIAGRHLYLRPATHLPHRPDAIVVEQDSWLVLGEQSALHEDERPAWVQANQLDDSPRYNPGSVIAKPDKPHRLLAIVYDLERQPICQPVWIEMALISILQYCHAHHLAHLQLPLLGCRRGGIELEQFIVLLESALTQHRGKDPAAILIALPDESMRRSLLQKFEQNDDAS